MNKSDMDEKVSLLCYPYFKFQLAGINFQSCMKLHANDFFVSNFPSEYAEAIKPVWRKNMPKKQEKPFVLQYLSR